MSWLQAAIPWEVHGLAAFNGEPVTYSRGSESVTIADASRCQQPFESTQQDPLVTRTTGVHWIFKASYLSTFAISIPLKGDQITDANGNVYQVLPLGTEDVYGLVAGYGHAYKVHSKEGPA